MDCLLLWTTQPKCSFSIFTKWCVHTWATLLWSRMRHSSRLKRYKNCKRQLLLAKVIQSNINGHRSVKWWSDCAVSYFHPLSTTVTQNATISSSSSRSVGSVIILMMIATTTSFSPTSSCQSSSAAGAQTGSGNTNQRTTLWRVHAVSPSRPASVITFTLSLAFHFHERVFTTRSQPVVLFELTINLLYVVRHTMMTVWASYKVVTVNALVYSVAGSPPAEVRTAVEVSVKHKENRYRSEED